MKNVLLISPAVLSPQPTLFAQDSFLCQIPAGTRIPPHDPVYEVGSRGLRPCSAIGRLLRPGLGRHGGMSYRASSPIQSGAIDLCLGDEPDACVLATRVVEATVRSCARTTQRGEIRHRARHELSLAAVYRRVALCSGERHSVGCRFAGYRRTDQRAFVAEPAANVMAPLQSAMGGLP